MSDVLCQDFSGSFRSGREVDLAAHPLTPNDNTAAYRANHRKKQRFETMRRALCGLGVSARRQSSLLRRRNISPALSQLPEQKGKFNLA